MAELRCERGVRLSELTTFKVGGPADRVVTVPSDVESVLAALALAAGDESVVLGGGSNLLASDEGFPGVALRIVAATLPAIDDVEVTVDAGFSWDGLVELCNSEGLRGIERTAGIPGTVGGAVVQNAGAFQQFVEPRVASVSCVDRASSSVRQLTQEECRFGYRTSIFKEQPTRFLLSEVRLHFERATHCLLFDGLAKGLEEAGLAVPAEVLPLAEASALVRALRSTKDHMVNERTASAGSFFKNVELVGDAVLLEATKQLFEERKTILRARGHDWVRTMTANREDSSQLLAGSLIATSGDLRDGPTFSPEAIHGPVRLGRSGPNTIINSGGAMARDIASLASRMAAAVGETYGIALEPEVVTIGDVPLRLS